jgi:hypothetical protein
MVTRRTGGIIRVEEITLRCKFHDIQIWLMRSRDEHVMPGENSYNVTLSPEHLSSMIICSQAVEQESFVYKFALKYFLEEFSLPE